MIIGPGNIENQKIVAMVDGRFFFLRRGYSWKTYGKTQYDALDLEKFEATVLPREACAFGYTDGPFPALEEILQERINQLEVELWSGEGVELIEIKRRLKSAQRLQQDIGNIPCESF